MQKTKITIDVRPLSGAEEVAGACDDARCFLDEVSAGKSAVDPEPLTAGQRARSARWLAETALAIALHFEASVS
jgi:hypothetical protein